MTGASQGGTPHQIGSSKYRRSSDGLSTELAQTWLSWQCRMVAGIIRGKIYRTGAGNTLGTLLATWPGEGEGESQLEQAAVEVLKAGRGKVFPKQKYGPNLQRTCDLVSCPLLIDGQPVAVLSVMISTRSEPQQHAVLQLLQWGGLWMESLAKWKSSAREQDSADSIELIAALLSHRASKAAALELANRLAERFSCERVSVGLRQGVLIRLTAISHLARFDPHSQLVRRIEAAMEEALDQSASLIFPGIPLLGSMVTRATAELSAEHGQGSIMTLLLPGQNGCIGAVTLERSVDDPFEDRTLDWCESFARAVGPALESKQHNERPLPTKAFDWMRRMLQRLLGPSLLALKLALLGLGILIWALSMAPGTHKITAPAGIEGAVRQILVAPQDGFIKDATVRAGDLVSAGQMIARLDDSDLNLELQKWRGERGKIEKEYQEALAKRDRTELSLLRVRMEQVDAELALVREKIERTRLLAPFDGVLVSGDLSQSLGAPVAIGEILFEVAPLQSYRVVLEVDEHDVAGLKQGSQGRLIVTALPDSSFAIRVDQVVPVAESSEGSNYFKVEASLIEPSPLLRPGMRGVGKVEMGERDLLWIWTHELVDRLRLWFWALGF